MGGMEVDPLKAVKTCPACKGDGELSDGSKCRLCRGTGLVEDRVGEGRPHNQ